MNVRSVLENSLWPLITILQMYFCLHFPFLPAKIIWKNKTKIWLCQAERARLLQEIYHPDVPGAVQMCSALRKH